ncbi:MAG: sodium:solute symporter [Paracoccaceae bacterium]|nr:MAG: sodium:solute symporter [Paracoccaceae bacterium]
MAANLLIAVATGYVALLFLVAFLADRRAAAGRARWLRSPVVYTLSISVYCTAWTFYGAVGSAARSGLEFAAIYTGPTLVFVGWWFLLRKLVRIGRSLRITSVADLLSSRYGKSPAIAVIVTLIAVVGSTPYIALQLQSLTLSFSVLAAGSGQEWPEAATAFWLAAGLALFTILFGTRNVDANERHHGVVTAIALEAVVKLLALIAVGIFAVWGVAGGLGAAFARADPQLLAQGQVFGERWVAITLLSASAVICLPRMFQVTVVENVDERHLATAAWAFPLYLMLICLFVLPIAIIGRAVLPADANPDLFVLTLPLALGREELALLAFLGGFSSATSMVIVAAIALSTMLSNHIIVPLWLAGQRGRHAAAGDVRAMLLASRRAGIVAILALGYLYFRITGGSEALAAIGLIAFAGAAQIMPALLAGIFWRGATRSGALAGVTAGSLIWAYTLFLPSFDGSFLLSAATLADGPWGIAALRPQALFGLQGLDPLVHCMFWSLTANVGLLATVSLLTGQSLLERLQAALFVDVFRMRAARAEPVIRRSATSGDLYTLSERILGRAAARQLFREMAAEQGRADALPEATPAMIERLERALAGAVGAASAHAMVSQITGGETISMEALISIADETAQIVDYSRRLESKSRELEATAAELRRANRQLQEISAQKDAFLNHVSHELRTPMTSIRSFAEILREGGLTAEERQRFVTIIHEESQRLTRLLDEILDLSFLESGRVNWQLEPVDVEAVIDQALAATEALIARSGMVLHRAPRAEGLIAMGQRDRLAQVFINLVSNAVKYAQGAGRHIAIRTGRTATDIFVEVADDGPGVPPEDRFQIFEKFARARGQTDSRGAGLGLPISREIMRNLGGDLRLVPTRRGATFRVTLPLPQRAASVA